MTQEKPKRRWYQFSLRTMFVLVFLVSIPLAWVGYSLNWIRERREIVPNRGYNGCHFTSAPNGLWLFGESGIAGFVVENEKDRATLNRLFPEAKVSVDERLFTK